MRRREQAEAESTADEPGASAKPARPASKHRYQRWLWVSLQLFAAGLVFVSVDAWQTRGLLSGSGQAAPDFQLHDANGKTMTSGSFAGKTTLVHFWATWCGVCRQEVAALNWLHENLADDEALITVVADSEDASFIMRFVEDHGIEYPVLLGTRQVLEAYRVAAFPTNYYIDKTGAVRDTTVGLSTRFSMWARLGCTR